MKTLGEKSAAMSILGLAFPAKDDIIKISNEIKCLQGGVKAPTGGIVRERFVFSEVADPAQFRDRQ